MTDETDDLDETKLWNHDYLIDQPKVYVNISRSEVISILREGDHCDLRRSILNIMNPTQFHSFNLFHNTLPIGRGCTTMLQSHPSQPSADISLFNSQVFDMFYSKPDQRTPEFVLLLASDVNQFKYALSRGLQAHEIPSLAWCNVSELCYRVDDHDYDGMYEDYDLIKLLISLNIPLPLGHEAQVLSRLIYYPQEFELVRQRATQSLPPATLPWEFDRDVRIVFAPNLDHILRAGIPKQTLVNSCLIDNIVRYGSVLLRWWIDRDMNICDFDPSLGCHKLHIDPRVLGHEAVVDLINYLIRKGCCNLIRRSDILYSSEIIELLVKSDYYNRNYLEIWLSKLRMGSYHHLTIENVLKNLDDELTDIKNIA
jgi:hypothetical protein